MRLSTTGVGLALVASATLAGAATPDAAKLDRSRLYAIDAGDGIRLQWHPKAWAADQVGYVLKRRLGEATAWQTLPLGVIRPAYDPARDGATLGMNATQAADFAAWKSSGKVKLNTPVPAEKLRTELVKHSGFPASDLIVLTREGRQAYLGALACVDNAAPAGEGLVYGLFVARESGAVDAEPVAVAQVYRAADRAAWVAKSGVKFSAGAGRANTALSWRMPLQQARNMAIGSFAVEKQRDGETTWTTVTPEIPFHVEGTNAVWNIGDAGAPDAADRTYRFIPKDVFQNVYPAHEFKVAKQAYVEPTSVNLGPRDIRLTRTDEGALRVKWTQPTLAWQEYTVSKFRLVDVFDTKKVLAECGADTTELTLSPEALKDLPGMIRLLAIFVDPRGSEVVIQSTQAFDHYTVKAVINPPKPLYRPPSAP